MAAPKKGRTGSGRFKRGSKAAKIAGRKGGKKTARKRKR